VQARTEDVQVLRTEKRGRWIYCSVNPASLELISEFLARPIAREETTDVCCP